MNFNRRRVLALSLAGSAIPGLFASAAVQAQDRKTLVIGATAGPYADQVRLGIQPILEKKGYRVRIVEFNDYVQPNFALAQGSLDANVFQHSVYLAKFATENKLALSELVKVPTAPIALFSHKHRTLDVKEGAQVALPSDPTNAARALVVLQDIGWVKLRDGVDPIRASERDVAVNLRKIKLVPIEAAQLPRSLDDVDYAFVNGNFAIASGLKITQALALEKTGPTYQNVVAIRTSDKDKPWVKDLADAYRSREFLVVTETRFPGFVKTDDQQALALSSAK